MISDLKTRSSAQLDRLVRSSDEQALDWQTQRALLEQHYKQIVAEIKSRNEVNSSFLMCFNYVSISDLLNVLSWTLGRLLS